MSNDEGMVIQLKARVVYGCRVSFGPSVSVYLLLPILKKRMFEQVDREPVNLATLS